VGRVVELAQVWVIDRGLCSPVSLVVGAVVPAAVSGWGLCSRCPGVGRYLSGVHLSSFS